MPLSSIIKKHCETCGKIAIESSRLDLGSSRLISLECGHCYTESGISAANYDEVMKDGRKLMPFQVETVKFAEESNARCLIAHEQGLGKTFCGAYLLRIHKTELLPAVIVTKKTIQKQWAHELVKIVDTSRIQVIYTSKIPVLPGFDFYITTYDLLDYVNESLAAINVTINTLIIDECQAIKNHLTARAKAVQKFGNTIPHIIGMSGTPIKNNAGEYFTILNLLQPSRFPEFNRFLRDYCDSYETMWGYKVGGLSSIERFQEATKDFIIRKTQKEVLPDLFALKQPRKFQHVEMSGKFKRAYVQALDELEELMYSEDSERNTAATIAVMSRMRQLTGLSKTVECTDLAIDHLLSTNRKLIIFAHHHGAVDLLELELNKWLKDGGYNPCVMIRAGDNGSDKVRQFSQENTPFCIASTLASGEGLDGLQTICSDMILLERQWNPANEEQVEGRLGRIGQTNPVNFIYMIASETIDEYFTELVETKRSYVASALDGEVVNWNESSLLKELATILVTKGKKRWSL